MTSASQRHPSLFIFDLDGTLIDSRADIAAALNRALARLRLPRLAEEQVAEYVGYGMQKLIERSLREATGEEPSGELMHDALAIYKEEYGRRLLDQTQLLPMVQEALDGLSWAKFAVATNKAEGFSRRILEGLGVADRFAIIMGGDSVSRGKPDPEALLRAMAFCRVAARDTVMVGDSAVDIQAGKAAHVTTCGVQGGFRSREELVAAGCDLIVENLLELCNRFQPPAID